MESRFVTEMPVSWKACAVAVSFEFFPPKTAAMEASLWEAIRKLEPLAPGFRLGDIRRGRIDARADPCDRVAHSEGNRTASPPRI